MLYLCHWKRLLLGGLFSHVEAGKGGWVGHIVLKAFTLRFVLDA